ncbi:hypothetical protein GCM10009539_02430 [Cryptosporangium japonicum]|uniref:Uncharacterized protein n=1 Tax=Cryptosporangium japonicum TaxID=80872 RepID=A0ABN0TG12_9ACTN
MELSFQVDITGSLSTMNEGAAAVAARFQVYLRAAVVGASRRGSDGEASTHRHTTASTRSSAAFPRDRRALGRWTYQVEKGSPATDDVQIHWEPPARY